MGCCTRTGSLLRRASNIVGGFAYMAAGVNEELAAGRKAICDTCPQLRGGRTCSICGCVVDAKTRINGEVCPIGKW